VICKLDVYLGVIGNRLHSWRVIFQACICEQIVYSIMELFSFHLLKCLENHIVCRKERVVRADILLFEINSLVKHIVMYSFCIVMVRRVLNEIFLGSVVISDFPI
jgi:hypothetical protein